MRLDNVERLREYARTVDFGDGDSPPPDQWCALPALTKSLLEELHTLDAGIKASYEWQDTSYYARISLPPALLQDTNNPFVAVVISKFGRLTTIQYEWDVKHEVLTEIQALLERQGWHYVVYRLFGNPVDNSWRYSYDFHQNHKMPPVGKDQIQNEDLWRSFFDYT